MATKNILVFRNDRFGEFLLNIPAFRALKQLHPDVRLSLITSETVQPLAQCVPYIDEILIWNAQRHSLRDVLAFAQVLRRKKYDAAVIFNPVKEANVAVFFAGIPLRVGYDRKWGFLLNRKVLDRKAEEAMHEVEQNLALAGLIGAKTDDASLTLQVPGESVGAVRDRFNLVAGVREFVAVHPWTSDPVKQWEERKFVALVKGIVTELKIPVVIVGGRDEASRDSGAFAGIPNVVNAAGKTSLVELAALLQHCRLLVSADSGPVHCACCVQTPAIVLFRTDLPGKGYKRWGPWDAHSRVIARKSLSDILPQDVLAEIRTVLGKGGS